MTRIAPPQTAGHRATVAVYLVGHHTAQAVQMARSLLITLPAARIRIRHPQALYAAVTGWYEAERLAGKTFSPTVVPHSAPPQTDAETAAHVAFNGPVPGPQVDARAAAVSLSGAGQVRVQVGPLSITTGDRAAFQAQLDLWTRAYKLGTDLWSELPSLEQTLDDVARGDKCVSALTDRLALAAAA
ncbi:hypothetical protein AB0F20_09620 [Streptomyces goshikiensis]|uniref:hypothetical protein n=1 Tax=Streptomyces goshikiensis TaxID=1942 RepID=UPI0033D43D24